MEIKEVLEKAKVIAFEKGKCYLILIDESSQAADMADIISGQISERFDVTTLAGVVDNIGAFKIFEFEK